jgi:hypothetical protein
MGRKRTWTDEDLENFKSKTVLELRELYPTKSYEYLRAIKQYYMEKQPNELDRLSQAFSEAGVEFTPEELAKADRAGFHVGYIRNADGEIEYTKPLPHVDFGKQKGKDLVVSPVVPALITVDRARIPKRDHDIIFVFSDAQIGYRRVNDELVPLHDERAIKAAQKLANDLRPNYVVDCGDTTDFAELGKYPVDSNHFLGTLQPSLQRTHDMLAEFTAATPKAERHMVDSNHVKRLGDYVLRNAFALYGVTSPGERYPALSYPGLIKLDDIGWNFHGGYGTAGYDHKGRGDLAFIHGVDSVAQGSTAAKVGKKNWDRNIVQGHAHRVETQYHTDRHGRIFGAFVVGSLCRIDGAVPSYYSAIDQFNQPVTNYENWQNGVLIIRDYGEGNYQFDQVVINNGVIRYNGKEYRGES